MINKYINLVKNIAIFALGSIGSKLIIFLLVPLYTNYLTTEEYGIAFRKGSDTTEAVNAVIAQLVADGTLPALAEKYGLALAPAITD